MPLWTRIALLLTVGAWSLYRGVRMEDKVLRRLVARARGSVKRAFVAVTLHYLALVGVLVACGLFAAVAYHAGAPVVVVIMLLLAGLVRTAPAMWVLAPSEFPGSATSFRDLRRLRASKGVARAIVYTAVAYHFLLLFPAMLGTMAAVIITE